MSPCQQRPRRRPPETPSRRRRLAVSPSRRRDGGPAHHLLTAFELLAFSIIFGWISVFIRFIDAVAARGSDTASDPLDAF